MKTIEGWIIKYGLRSLPMTLPNGQKVYEVFAAGALAASVAAIIAGSPVIEANLEHSDTTLTRMGTTGKNVVIEHRAEGVYATIQLLADTVSQDVFTKVNGGIVRGMSIEFNPAEDPTYTAQADGSYLRTITRANMTGFAITVAGLYPDAKITAATDTGDAARSIRTADAATIAQELERIQSPDRCRQQQRELLGYHGYR